MRRIWGSTLAVVVGASLAVAGEGGEKTPDASQLKILEKTAAVQRSAGTVSISHPTEYSELYEGTLEVRSEPVKIDAETEAVIVAQVPVRCFAMIGDPCSAVEQTAPVKGKAVLSRQGNVVHEPTGWEVTGTVDGVIADLDKNEGETSVSVHVVDGQAALRAVWPR